MERFFIKLDFLENNGDCDAETCVIGKDLVEIYQSLDINALSNDSTVQARSSTLAKIEFEKLITRGDKPP